MTISQYISACCAIQKISHAEMARRIGQSPQNYHNKLKRNSLRPDDLERIADALGARFILIYKRTGEPLL